MSTLSACANPVRLSYNVPGLHPLAACVTPHDLTGFHRLLAGHVHTSGVYSYLRRIDGIAAPSSVRLHVKLTFDFPGTYGGHIELSAFARLYRHNIKIIQPDVVYVMEHGAGEEPEEEQATSSRRRGTSRWEGPMTEGTLYVA